MAERHERSPRPLPMTVFDADTVEPILREKKGLLLPEGTKALLTLVIAKNESPEEVNFGPVLLREPFKGAYHSQIKEHYADLPPNAVRMVFLPDSVQRRERKSQSVKWPISMDPEVEAIDKRLAAEFLADRQDDLEFFNIDPNTVKQVRLQVAVNREIKVYS